MKNFYKNKKILITGHTGFKGIWLTNILINFGSKVYGISLNDLNKNNYKKCCASTKVHNYYFNILNKKKLKKTLDNIKPEIIFHFAAQAIVTKSYQDPANTFETNVIGTSNILNIARSVKNLKSVIIATSDKCYQNNDQKKYFHENDRLGGNDPYSASKAAAEIISFSYLESFYKKKKIGVATVRAGNVIGGGDWSKDRLIPDCARSIIKKRKMIIRSKVSTRPWQHVLDVLHGYILLAKRLHENSLRFSGSWNFGPTKKSNNNVYEIVELFFTFLQIKKKIFFLKNKDVKESKYLYLNSNKSKKKLKWKSSHTIRESVSLTAEWYYNYIHKKNYRNIFSKQIRNYNFFK